MDTDRFVHCENWFAPEKNVDFFMSFKLIFLVLSQKYHKFCLHVNIIYLYSWMLIQPLKLLLR
jgi:hypothetical protein